MFMVVDLCDQCEDDDVVLSARGFVTLSGGWVGDVRGGMQEIELGQVGGRDAGRWGSFELQLIPQFVYGPALWGVNVGTGG